MAPAAPSERRRSKITARAACRLRLVAALLGALALLSAPASASQDDWPEFWREHADAESRRILDEAFSKFVADGAGAGRPTIYLSAANALTRLLEAQPPPSSDRERLQRGRAWMFVGELRDGLGEVDACLQAEQHGLALIESAAQAPTIELTRMLISHANTYAKLGRKSEARPLVDRAAADLEHIPALDELERARLLDDLGAAYHRLDLAEQSLPLALRSFAIRERMLGPEHLDVALSASNLAIVHEALGHIDDAAALYERALAIRSRLLPPDSVEIANTLFELASTLRLANQPVRALPLYERALAIRQKNAAPDDTSVLALVLELCRARLQAGHFDAVPAECNRLHEQLPGTALALLPLAHAKLLLGEREAALTLYRRVLPDIASEERLRSGPLADFDRFLSGGWRSRDVAFAKSWFEQMWPLHRQALARFAEGRTLFQQRKWQESLRAAVEATELSERVYGPRHEWVALGLTMQADSLYKLTKTMQEIDEDTAMEPLYRRSLAIYEAAEPRDPARVLEATRKLRTLLRVKKDRDADTVPVARKAHELSKAGLDAGDTAAIDDLYTLGDVLWRSGSAAEAIAPLRDAFERRKRLPDASRSDVTSTRGSLVAALRDAGRAAEIGAVYRWELAQDEEKHGARSMETAESVYRLSDWLQKNGPVEEAEALLRRRAADLDDGHRSILNDPRLADALNALANLLMLTGRHTEAEPLLRRALELRRPYKHVRPAFATNLQSLGVLLHENGRYADAEALLREALQVLAEPENAPEFVMVQLRARCLDTLAALLNATGREAEAAVAMTESLRIHVKSRERGSPEDEAQLAGLEDLAPGAPLTAAAERSIRYVIKMSEKKLGPDSVQLAMVLDYYAEQLRGGGRAREAKPVLQRVHGIYDRLGYRTGAASVLRRLGRAHIATGDFAAAEACLLRAYPLARTELPGLTGEILHDLQEVYRGSRRPALAVFYGKQAVNTLQGLRAGLQSGSVEVQKSYLSKVRPVYDTLVGLLIDQGRFAEAEQVLAMLKEDEYFDFIRRDADADPRTTQSSYDAREQQWMKRYAQISTDVAALGREHGTLTRIPVQLRTEAQRTRLAALERDLGVVREAFDRYLAELRAAFSTASEARRVDLAKHDLDELLSVQGALGELQEHSGRKVVLVHFLVTSDRVRMLVTTPETQFARESAVGEAALNRLVFEYRQGLQNPQRDPRGPAQALYERLIAPLEADLRQLQPDVLMVSLDGVLRYVPIAALHDGRQWLIERFAVAMYNPAAHTSLGRSDRSAWRVAALGMSQPSEGYAALPSVPFELDDIVRDEADGTDGRGALPGVVYLDDAFVPEALIGVLSDKERYPVVHIASHFRFVPGNEADSFLIAGRGVRLTLADIRKGRFRLYGLDLLTLSACETAMGGGEAQGREVESLGVTAQKQGARSVMATLWSVADASTGLLMSHVYRTRQEFGVSKAEALRRAQLAMLGGEIDDRTVPLELRGAARVADNDAAGRAFPVDAQRPFAHPFFWAPFILMGNWL